MSDESIEQEIQAKGLTAPRVKPEHIEANIAGEHYFTALQGARCAVLDYVVADGMEGTPPQPLDPELGLLTFCVLVLKNGFTVTGESACASPENFDAEIGRKIARQNAVQKIWPLMGYALREQLCALEEMPPLSEDDRETINLAVRQGKKIVVLSSPETTWIDRLIAEKDELGDRMTKLDKFMRTEEFSALPKRQRHLLRDQRVSMNVYFSLLMQRLIDATPQDEPPAEPVF